MLGIKDCEDWNYTCEREYKLRSVFNSFSELVKTLEYHCLYRASNYIEIVKTIANTKSKTSSICEILNDKQ